MIDPITAGAPPWLTGEAKVSYPTTSQEAPAAPGIGERLRLWVSSDGTAMVYRPIGTQALCADILVAADLIDSQSAEIARLKAQKWDVKHADTLNDIAQMGMARDAAIEGQSYWQARAERLEGALQRLANLTPASSNAHTAQDLYLTVRAIADTALADAQTTQGEG